MCLCVWRGGAVMWGLAALLEEAATTLQLMLQETGCVLLLLFGPPCAMRLSIHPCAATPPHPTGR